MSSCSRCFRAPECLNPLATKYLSEQVNTRLVELEKMTADLPNGEASVKVYVWVRDSLEVEASMESFNEAFLRVLAGHFFFRKDLESFKLFSLDILQLVKDTRFKYMAGLAVRRSIFMVFEEEMVIAEGHAASLADSVGFETLARGFRSREESLSAKYPCNFLSANSMDRAVRSAAVMGHKDLAQTSEKLKGMQDFLAHVPLSGRPN